MMGELIPALLTGGLGAAIGGIGTAVVQSISGKGVSRAEAADRVTNAAGNLADRLDKDIVRRDLEITRLRTALALLAEAVEDLVLAIPDGDLRERAQHAVTEARIALR